MSAEAPLESYLAGKWSRGQGIEMELTDPTIGTVLATVSARDLDLDGALKFARQKGGPALRALSYGERAKLLGVIADVLAANRTRYEEIAIANSGNTKTDAAIDIDGGIGTLKYYCRLGAALGEAKSFIDGKPVRLTKAENYQAIHLLTPRHGAAIHINAFTAIRRVLAPADRASAVADALSARLPKTTLGDPRNEATRMGPLVNRVQQASVLQGIGKLAKEATIVCGAAQAPRLDGIDGSKSAFVSPTLLKVDSASKAQAVHETEIFGPVATIVPYVDEAESFSLAAQGGGSLVVSVFGDDLNFLARAVTELGACNGRVLAVDPSVADGHSGHGIVMPQCHHGGPGRAGNGEELGGLNGLRLYHQRVAVQGSAALVSAVSANAISFA